MGYLQEAFLFLIHLIWIYLTFIAYSMYYLCSLTLGISITDIILNGKALFFYAVSMLVILSGVSGFILYKNINMLTVGLALATIGLASELICIYGKSKSERGKVT